MSACCLEINGNDKFTVSLNEDYVDTNKDITITTKETNLGFALEIPGYTVADSESDLNLEETLTKNSEGIYTYAGAVGLSGYYPTTIEGGLSYHYQEATGQSSQAFCPLGARGSGYSYETVFLSGA